jgi:hypothetical protein
MTEEEWVQNRDNQWWVRHWSELNVDEVLELKPHEVAPYCERVLDATTLSRELEAGHLSSSFYLSPQEARAARKQFCEFLGIGDSTLSGWLKAKRIPRMAKEAYVLLKTLLLLQGEMKRIKEEQIRNVVIVQEGGKYQLVRFITDKTGALMGTIMARDIPDEGAARILAGSTKAFDTLKDFRDALIEIVGDGSELDWEDNSDSYKQLNYRVLRASLAALGFEEWEKRFLPFQIGSEQKEFYRAWQVLAKADPERAQAKLGEPPPLERLANLTERHAELTAQSERIQAEIADTHANRVEKARADLAAAEALVASQQPSSPRKRGKNSPRQRGKANGKADS